MPAGGKNALAVRVVGVILFFVFWLPAFAQQKKATLVQRMERFHELMVEPKFYLDQYLHDSLRYGHSNGWIEDRKTFLQDLTDNTLDYHSIKTDSVEVILDKKIATVRFVGDYDVSLNGNRNTFHLRVLEVWVRKGNRWKILARQAIR